MIGSHEPEEHAHRIPMLDVDERPPAPARDRGIQAETADEIAHESRSGVAAAEEFQMCAARWIAHGATRQERGAQ